MRPFSVSARAQVLAKFLGVLAFSPNWDLSALAPSSAAFGAAVDEAALAMNRRSPAFDINYCLRAAWHRGALLLGARWIVRDRRRELKQ